MFEIQRFMVTDGKIIFTLQEKIGWKTEINTGFINSRKADDN